MKLFHKKAPGVHHEKVFSQYACSLIGSEDNSSQLIEKLLSDSTY